MAGRTATEIEIAAPPDFVFDLTNDLSRWTEMFTEYESVEILEQGPRHYTFRLTTKPDEEGRSHSWISRRDLFPEESRIEARRLEPLKPFDSMHIQWWYEPAGEGTRMRWQQEFTVADGAGFSERDAEDYITGNSEEQMKSIKRFVEDAWQATQR